MLISPFAKGLEPYKYGEQPQDGVYTKLNTNESPFAPSDKVVDILKNFDVEGLRLYSDPENKELKQAIAKRFDVKEKNVFVGNGSDEVLAFVFAAFFKGYKKSILFPDLTYSFYPVYCKLWNIRYEQVKVKKDFSIDFNDYKKDCAGVIIANPNAPTGLLLSIKEIEGFLKNNKDKILVIDEAYIDFAGESASVISLINKYDNLVVARTFSKAYSLAGLRCGYAIAAPWAIETLNTVKNSFNSYTVNMLTEKIASAAILDQNYYKSKISSIIDIREKYKKVLKDKYNFYVTDSRTNFLFVKKEGTSGKYLYEELKKRRVLVRHFNQERIEDYLRITVGSSDDMKKLIKEIKGII